MARKRIVSESYDSREIPTENIPTTGTRYLGSAYVTPSGLIDTRTIASTGTIASGSIYLEVPTSRVILSGQAGFSGTTSGLHSVDQKCRKCGVSLGLYTIGNQITVIGVSGLYENWCWSCAGYSSQKESFETREDWIREGVPFTSGAPALIIADWLDEHDRYKDAEYLRTYCSGH